MTEDYSALVAELRESPSKKAQKAADAITEQAAEIERLRAERNKYREALQNTHDDLDGGFVACQTCGSQEDTSDMDCMELYIKPALKETGE
jgi:RNA polymerase-binding transcription factor DksA